VLPNRNRWVKAEGRWANRPGSRFGLRLSVLGLQFLLAVSSYAACTQTLSVGANIASAVSSAANGSTICLNNGNYGTVNLFDIARSGFVTLQSVTGTGAQMSPQVGNSKFIRFQSMTLTDVGVNSCSLNIEFINTPFAPNAGGLLLDASACPSTTHNYLIDGATFNQVGQALFEGRLNCRDCNGVTIKNSVFSGVSASNASDGIQTQGNSRNLTIGPGNRFSGIQEALCGATHCDAIQFQGGGTTLVTGNLFENGDTFIMSPDGCSGVTVSNNVFNGANNGYDFNLQFGSCDNLTFRHNTLVDSSLAVDSKTGSPASANAQVQNNILIGNTGVKTSGGSGCSNCTFAFNLYDSAGDAVGSSNVIATPSFLGGSLPSTWAGWQLGSSSAGKNAGNDGQDMGTLFYGSGSVAAGSSCDCNSDGQTNVSDVQLIVNQAIGAATCTADINKDGTCNVIDVQRVVNAALGGQCVTQ
jgi:hypothetical protein